MPRSRNIKPGFFTNDALVELPMATRLLFIGLWTLADREGRLEDRPKKIKMEVFPADDVDVDEALSTLVSSAFIQRYTVDGVAFVQVENFIKHQRPHSNESASTIPPPPTGRKKKARNDAENESPVDHGEQGGEPRRSSRAGAGAIKTDTGLLDTDTPTTDTGLLDPSGPATPAVADPPPIDPNPPPSKPLQPYDLLEALIETLGQDVSVLSPSEKSRQLGVAKRLLADGMTAQDVRNMTTWLRAQTWMTSGIDFHTIEKYRGKWQMSGKPANVTHLAAPQRNSYRGDRSGRDGLTDDERGWRENPGPKGWSADELARMGMADDLNQRSGT